MYIQYYNNIKDVYIYYKVYSFICKLFSFIYSLIHEIFVECLVKARHCAVIKATKLGSQKITLVAEWRKHCGVREERNQKDYLGAIKECTVWERTQAGKQVFQRQKFPLECKRRSD